MPVYNGRARVISREQDLSTRVDAFEGVYGAIALPNAPRGRLNHWVLTTSESQLLNRYTPYGRVEVGDDLAFFVASTFLSESNKCWTNRVGDADTYMYANIRVDVGDEVFDKEAGTGVDQEAFWAGKVDEATDLVGDIGTATPSINTYDDIIPGAEAITIVAVEQGEWANDLSIRIYPGSEPDTFFIEVYLGSTQVDRIEASRLIGKRNGYGRNMYIDEVTKGSNWIRGFNNPLVADNILPKFHNPHLIQDVQIFTEGVDGLSATEGQMIIEAEKLYNANDYPLTLILDGDWATVPYQQKLDAIANKRQDCVALLTMPYEHEYSSNYLEDVLDYKRNQLLIDSSYSALYTSHLKIYDKHNDRSLWVTPVGHVGSIISKNAELEEIWYPPAGWRRAIIREVQDCLRRYSDGEKDILYNNSINPIRFKGGRGIVVWGNKTLQYRASHTDRLNVRLMLIVVRTAIAKALEEYLFQLNTPEERLIARKMIESYMDGIQGRKGVYSYYVVCDDTNNSPEDVERHIMRVDLFVKPTQSIEYVPFTTYLTPLGLDFSQASQLAA
jgi:hypothetical protein